jgi:predicted MFS family arabinose efflux permease
MALIGRLFQRQRAIAIGVVATGNGLGTLALVPLAERIINERGWRDAYVALAVLGAIAVALAVVLVCSPPSTTPPPPIRKHLQWAFRLTSFRSLFSSGLLMSIGLYVALGFIVPFAKDDGVASATAARLVGLVGLSSIVGRLGFTALSGRLSAVQLYRISLALQPIAYVLWLVSNGSLALLVTFCVLLGTSYGGFVALGPEVLVHLFGVNGLGALMGATFLAFGIGGLVGPPAAGWLADTSDGHTVPIVTVIVVLIAAVASTAPLRNDPVSGSTSDGADTTTPSVAR